MFLRLTACIRFAALSSSCLVAFAQTNVLTQHNDIGRTGQNLNETQLTTTTVAAGNFGKLFTLAVDGAVYAQPLYMSNVSIGGNPHRVVFVATEHDSVYAFDAANGSQLWQVSMTDAAHGAAAGATPDPESDTGCADVSETGEAGEYGITGTPVIDSGTGTLYVVAKTFEGSYPVQRLHALDVTTGFEKPNSPVVITATVSASGSGSSNGVLNFDPKFENQRPGLLLLNGNVYMAFAAFCDISPWHGWVLGYNAATLTQTGAFLTSPTGNASGIWMSGAGLAADLQSNVPRIFPVTGNGTFSATSAPYGTNNMSYGDDIIRLNAASGITVADMFTPSNQKALSDADEDVGAGGAIVLPDQAGLYPHLLAQLGKSGLLYLLNRDNLGGFASTDNAVQEVEVAGNCNYFCGIWGNIAYWNSNIYVWPADKSLSRFPLTSGVLSTSPSEVSSQNQNASISWAFGVTPSISANGNQPGSGIVWTVDPTQNPQVLYAHNASNVSQLLWSSAQNAGRDAFSSVQKFAVPTIADGNVFVGANKQVLIFGLLNNSPAPDFSLSAAPSSVLVAPGSTTASNVSIAQLNEFSGSVNLSVSGLPSGVTASLSGTSSGAVVTLVAAANAPLTTSPAAITVIGTSASSTVRSTSFALNVSNWLPVDMGASFNVNAIANNGSAPRSGGFDTASYAYSANLLGSSVTALGVPFFFGTPGIPDASSQKTILLSGGRFTALNFIGAASYGNQLNQNFVVTYNDGSTSTFTQSVSDWATPQSFSGETTAVTTASHVAPGGGTSASDVYLYAYSIPLNTAHAVQSVTLPDARNVSVLAMTLSGPVSGSQPSQTITFNALPSQAIGASLALNATASSGLAVSYSSSTPTVCTVSGSTVSLLAAGTCSITASQVGNANFTAANPVVQSFNVGGQVQSITFMPIGTQKVGASLVLVATASSGLAVSYASLTSAVCTVAGSSANFIVAGSCSIMASQAGNGSYAAARSVTQTFGVSASASVQTISFSGIATQTVNTPLALSATASSGLPVTFSSATTAVCSVTGSTATFASAGTCTIAASQSGNASFASATVTQSFSVVAANKGSFTLSPAAANVSITPQFCFFGCYGGSSTTDRITVVPANGFSGAVSFSISGLPPGVIASFNPTSVTNGSTTLTLSPSRLTTRNAQASLTITATSGSTGISASTRINLSY